MEFTQNDFNESIELAELIRKIDLMDAEYVNTVTDEIYAKQPFFLTVLLGYRLDVRPKELEELMKIYFLIWEYFKSNQHVQTRKVNQAYFEKIQKRNIQMLKYSEGELTEKDKLKVFSPDLQNLQSKSLLAAIFFRFNNRPVLSKMKTEKKGLILIGIKSFIECFEKI